MRVNRSIRLLPLAVALAGSAALVAPVAAHEDFDLGEYHVGVGWINEPTIVGQLNAVEFHVTTHDGDPVLDLEPGDVTVVVSTAGQDTAELPLEAAFDAEEGEGELGQYTAELVPTTPGEYTFHFTGTIHELEVDLSVTSGEDTFSPVLTSGDLEFPVKVPTLAEVAERLERIDGRIEELQGSGALEDLVAGANANAQAALDAANRAALVGALVGGAGLVVAVIALFVAWRAGRKGAGSA